MKDGKKQNVCCKLFSGIHNLMTFLKIPTELYKSAILPQFSRTPQKLFCLRCLNCRKRLHSVAKSVFNWRPFNYYI